MYIFTNIVEIIFVLFDYKVRYKFSSSFLVFNYILFHISSHCQTLVANTSGFIDLRKSFDTLSENPLSEALHEFETINVH